MDKRRPASLKPSIDNLVGGKVINDTLRDYGNRAPQQKGKPERSRAKQDYKPFNKYEYKNKLEKVYGKRSKIV